MVKKPKKEAVKPPEEKKPVAPQPAVSKPAAKPVAKAVEKAAAVVSQVAEAVKQHVVEPVVKAVKPKRKRFVREKKEKVAPVDNTPALPQPSKKATAKLMTKGLVVPPQEDPKTGQKPKV